MAPVSLCPVHHTVIWPHEKIPLNAICPGPRDCIHRQLRLHCSTETFCFLELPQVSSLAGSLGPGSFLVEGDGLGLWRLDAHLAWTFSF